MRFYQTHQVHFGNTTTILHPPCRRATTATTTCRHVITTLPQIPPDNNYRTLQTTARTRSLGRGRQLVLFRRVTRSGESTTRIPGTAPTMSTAVFDQIGVSGTLINFLNLASESCCGEIVSGIFKLPCYDIGGVINNKTLFVGCLCIKLR